MSPPWVQCKSSSSPEDRIEVLDCGFIRVGQREARKFNYAQTLRLQVSSFGAADSRASSKATVRLAHVHLPSSDRHPLKDSDKTTAMTELTYFAAVSREDFGIVCGDINEKQQKNMVDRLRRAAHGAGHWRHWEVDAKGEGDRGP